MLSIAEIFATAKRIREHIYPTPLRFSYPLSKQIGKDVYLKLENLQRTGSFKFRGALSKISLLSQQELANGVITASTGNHGLAVAAASQIWKTKATVVLPEKTPDAKTTQLDYYGASLIEKGKDYEDAEEEARRLQNERGFTFVHAFDDPMVLSGQGTIGLEIFQQLPEADSVIVPVGGGGLIGGIAASIKLLNPSVKVYGVQSTASPTMFNSYRAGKMVETPVQPTIAEGLAGRTVGDFTLQITLKYVDDIILVEEEEIKEAIVYLLEKTRLIVEGAGAVGIAALLTGKVVPEGDKVVVIVSGGNISFNFLKELLRA